MKIYAKLFTAVLLLISIYGFSQSAGPNQTDCQYHPIYMNATGTGTWTALSSNPATVGISTPSSATTYVFGFNSLGLYKFVWTTGGVHDTMSVTVIANPNAGPDQTITTGGTATMSATGTGTWSAAAANPGSSTITVPTSPTTTITGFIAAGTYTYYWTNSGGCADTALVIVSAGAISAGANQRYCQYYWGTTNISLNGSGTGTWAALPGNPSVTTFGSTTSSSTVVFGAVNAGIYRFTYSNGVVIDTTTINILPKPVAGPYQSTTLGGTATMAAQGSGTWTAEPHNPGSSTITQPTDSSTTITGFTVAGVYTYYWTNSLGCDDTTGVLVSACTLSGHISQVTDTSSGLVYDLLSPIISGGPGHYTYAWAFSNPIFYRNTDSTVGVSNNGIYTVHVTDTNGCTITLTDSVTNLPCSIQCPISYRYLGGGQYQLWSNVTGTSHPRYDWTEQNSPYSHFSTDTILITLFSFNSLLLEVSDSFSRCSNFDSVPIYASTCALTGSIGYFAYAGYDNVGVNIYGGSGQYNYVWTFNPLFNYGSSVAVYNNGIYTVNVTDTNGCTITLSDTISNLACSVQCPISYQYLGGGQYHFWTHLTGATRPLYIWQTAAGMNIDSSFTVTLPAGATGAYLTVYDSATGCQNNDSIHFTVPASANAGPDQTICQSTLAIMAATGTGTWTAWAGNPGAVTINAPTSPTTIIRGFNVPGTYRFIWTSGGYNDTANVIVNAAPSIHAGILISGGGSQACVGQCVYMNDTSSTSCGTLLYVIDWGQGSVDTTALICHQYTSAGTYHPIITLVNTCGCWAADTFTLIVNSCAPDTVWPGDADRNKIVDNADLLTIGLGYAATGPVRTVTGNVWQADPASDWAQTFTTYAAGVNYVNADCDGNGVIDANDTVAIVTNFGDIHAKTDGYVGQWRNGIPGLRVLLNLDTALNAQVLTTNIYLGDSALPVSNIYGLAFTFHYDPIVIDSTAQSFAFVSSWLGSQTNSININRNFHSLGEVKAAITGINHQPRSGNGLIATFIGTVTTGNINGKNLSYYTNLNYISDITAIDQYGNPVTLNAGIDSNYIGYYPNGINDISKSKVYLYPNPAASTVMVSSGTEMTEITITDMIGQTAKTIPLNNKTVETINISDIAAGVYTVRVSTISGIATTRLIVSR